MKKGLFYILIGFLPLGVFAQENGTTSHPETIGIKPSPPSNKKVVKSQKEVVFSDKLEWIKVDSTSGEKKKITTDQPSTTDPKGKK